MQHLRDTQASTLYWIKPRWYKPVYELRSDNELFCTMRWSTYNEVDPVSIVSADEHWTLMISKGVPPVIVQITDSSETVAVCKFSVVYLNPVTVEFVNGLRFRWHLTDWRRSYWAFSSEDAENLMFFKGVSWNLFRLKIQVDLTSRVKELPEAPLLAAFGMYVLIRMKRYLAMLGPR